MEVMALNARIHANTTLGLALTGIAGPSGGTEKKPVGTVYTCLSDPEGIKTRKFLFPGNRNIIKELAAYTALAQVRRYFLK